MTVIHLMFLTHSENSSILFYRLHDLSKHCCDVTICIYFEIKVCYPPAVQVADSFKNISEVQSYFLLCQVAPANYIVQEAPLVCPGKRTR